MDRESGQVATETRPMIAYSRSMGSYVELCAWNEKDAGAQAFGADCEDVGVIQIARDDIRHTHQADGSCIKVITPAMSQRASYVRAIMGRAFVAGYDMYYA